MRLIHTMAVLTILAAGAARANALDLDVPGSIPGTTTIFATDRGITVGTYEYQLGLFAADIGTYGFIFDGMTYQTFIPGFIGPPPSAGTSEPLGPFGVFDSRDQVQILSFNKTGGIGYFVYNPLNGEGVVCCGWVRSGIQDDFSTEINLRFVIGPGTVIAPDGNVAPLLYDTWPYPTFINGIGQVVGVFYNGVTTGCHLFDAITCSGEFLMSDGNFYFNYTTLGSYGFPPDEQVIGFVENGNSGTFRPVPHRHDAIE